MKNFFKKFPSIVFLKRLIWRILGINKPHSVFIDEKYFEPVIEGLFNVFENPRGTASWSKVKGIENDKNNFKIYLENNEHLIAKRIVLAGGVWLEDMLSWLNVKIPIKCLINQLIITERMPSVMKTVLSIANGLLSLKQFDNGTVLIGGGWQGLGDKERGGVEAIPENLKGNIRLACHVIPELCYGRMVRVWLGLEAETADALPVIGNVPGISNAYVIGSVHSGYTSGPYMGWLLSQFIMGQETEMPLFDPNRLINK